MANKKRRRKPASHRASPGPAGTREEDPGRSTGRGTTRAPQGDAAPDAAERRKRKEAARRRREQEEKRLRRRQRATRLLTVVTVVVVGYAAIQFFGRTNSPDTPAVYVSPSASPTAPATLPGMQTGAPPWSNGANAQLGARLAAIGLPPEGGTLHTHEHLDVFVNGQPVIVPSGIGLGSVGSPLHTHNDSGIIHVEASTNGPFTLGQFFDVWGVNLTSACLADQCGGGLAVWVDGHRAAGDPRQIQLVDHQEISVAYGTPAPHLSSYRFPALL